MPRSGFTIVELLVTIGIIGLLIALLLPAVQSARESARSTTCRNHLRNVALAAVQFESQGGSYPGYVEDMRPEDDIGTPRSWIFMLLPLLEQTHLYDAHSVPHSLQPDQSLEFLLCPSDPFIHNRDQPRTSYVANTGLKDQPPSGPASPPADWLPNGIFQSAYEYHYHSALETGTGKPEYIPLPNCKTNRQAGKYVSLGDGLTYTILLAENADAGSWTLPVGYPANWERFVACIWSPAVDAAGMPTPPKNATPGEGVGKGAGQIDCDSARPGAFHPRTANVAFADGHVKALSNDTSYLVYCLLMTPDGRFAKHVVTGTAVPKVFRETVLDPTSVQ